jgi:1-acyl-sn-glycerol-3-phosphate acyltransferase
MAYEKPLRSERSLLRGRTVFSRGAPNLARGWRAARTGFAFAVFGLGSLIFGLVGFPCLKLIPGTAQQKELRAQRLVHLGFRLFAWFSERLGLIRVLRIGTDRLRGPGPRLVIANHPTLLDVVLLIACMPQADCIVKQAHWRSHLMRRIVMGAGYIPNQEGDALVDICVNRLRQGRSLLLFPEGTRSPQRQLGPFRRGAAHIALRSGCDLVPVVVRCDPPTLMKGAKWYDVPDRTMQLTIEVGDPFVVREHIKALADCPLAARALTAEIRDFYDERLLAEGAEHARA